MGQNKTFIDFIGKNNKFPADKCIAISFFRPTTGSNAVNISGFDLEAGQSLDIAQNEGDWDTTDYEIVFSGSSGENLLYVTRIVPIDGK
jgi:hypothetical protein